MKCGLLLRESRKKRLDIRCYWIAKTILPVIFASQRSVVSESQRAPTFNALHARLVKGQAIRIHALHRVPRKRGTVNICLAFPLHFLNRLTLFCFAHAYHSCLFFTPLLLILLFLSLVLIISRLHLLVVAHSILSCFLLARLIEGGKCTLICCTRRI